MSNPYDTPNMTDAGRIQQETPEDRHRDVLDETFPPGTNPRLAAWAGGMASPLSDTDYDVMAGEDGRAATEHPIHVHGTPETGYAPIRQIPPAPMPEDVELHEAATTVAIAMYESTENRPWPTWAELPVTLQQRVIDSTDSTLRQIEAAGYRIVPVL